VAAVAGGPGSGSWLALALAVGAGLPVVVFLPAGVAAPAWAGGSWVPAAASGVWASALRWSPSLLAGLPGFGGGLPLPGSGDFPPPDPIDEERVRAHLAYIAAGSPSGDPDPLFGDASAPTTLRDRREQRPPCTDCVGGSRPVFQWWLRM
jgi:hypothetical protein